MRARYLIILAGPTAVGKTSLAVQLAKHLGTEIINADSRQIYREMKIGTSVPTPDQLSAVKHHLVGHKSIHDKYNASLFEQEAMEIIDHLFLQHETVVVTGGSGLYIDAVCRGIDDIPAVDPLIRDQMQQEYLSGGLERLQARLLIADPDYYEKADLQNPKRMLKALEIIEMTGRPYSTFLTGKVKLRDFNVIRIGLDMQRHLLHDRINKRVDNMVESGLVQEARNLYDFRHLNALNTVGYKELFDYFDGRFSLDEAVESVKGHTRQYARRQLTWFRRDKNYYWYGPADKEAILKKIMEIMVQHEGT